jgi:hypothetical protein
MDFEPTDEQRMLRESLSRLLEDSYTSSSATRIAHRSTAMIRPSGTPLPRWG